jgi:hypothetical protein
MQMRRKLVKAQDNLLKPMAQKWQEHFYLIGKKFGHHEGLKKKVSSYGPYITRPLLLTHGGLQLTNSLYYNVAIYTLKKLFHTIFLSVVKQDMHSNHCEYARMYPFFFCCPWIGLSIVDTFLVRTYLRNLSNLEMFGNA